MMKCWKRWIDALGKDELDVVLRALVRRYGELCPEQELCVLSVDRTDERMGQIDGIIRLLERMKETE